MNKILHSKVFFLKQHCFINNWREKVSYFKIINMIIFIFIIFILSKLYFMNFSYFSIFLLYHVGQHVSWTCIYEFSINAATYLLLIFPLRGQTCFNALSGFKECLSLRQFPRVMC